MTILSGSKVDNLTLQYPDRLILIVEPDPSTQANFTATLQQAGYHTWALSSLDEAYAYFKQAKIDVVVTDLFMPPESGLKLLAYIKQTSPETAIIITTAQATVETAVAALRQGATDYLLKPVPNDEFRQSVERAINQQRFHETNYHPDPLDELETLRIASELFLKNLSQNEVLSIIGDRALQMSRADYCEIFTTHPDGKAFVSTIRLPAEMPISPVISAESHYLAIDAIQRQKMIIINQPEDDKYRFQSWLIFPFKVSGNIVGALCLGHQQHRVFSPAIINLLSIFVDQASIAISNAHLFEDVTQAYAKLSLSRAEILASRNTLQTLFDGITDGLYIIDQALNILMVNKAEATRLALSVDEILAQQFDQLGWQEAAPDFTAQIKDTFVTGETFRWVSPELSQSPLTSDREMSLYPIISPEHRVEQVIILAQDMAQQKHLQASLFQSANLAAIGQLATSVAHEINNPLTIVLTNAQLAMAVLDPADEAYEMMEDAYDACNRIKQIVDNLVDLSNQEGYEFDKIDLVETLEETLTLIGHPLKEAGIQFLRIYHHTPTIVASSSHIKMAWMNLLRNAVEAITATGKPGKITITVRQISASQVQVTITDTGIGILDHYCKNIFTPFFTTKPIGHSVGLGLFTTKTIIEKHQGSITFQSSPGATCFITTLFQTPTLPDTQAG